MKLYKKIALIWLVTIGLISSAFVFFPSLPVEMSAMANNYIQALLFFITLYIFRKEPNKKNKLIFLNFIIFFGLSFYAMFHSFVGKAIFTANGFANLFSFEFHVAAYAFTLSFAIIYLVIDLLFNSIKTSLKYAVSVSIVAFFFLWHFGPIITNPMSLYQTEDMKQWKRLDTYTAAHHETAAPSTEALAKDINLLSWNNGVAVGELYPEENLRRIEYLMPYLEDNNFQLLMFKPLYMNMVYMDATLLFFMLLFFGYQYEKDPPQGAYIDKIMFVFLLFISTEILHYWGYMKSIEWNMYEGLFNAGQYITVALLSLMVVFFGLRLRFINSVTGEFYESELARNPQLITRWKDGIDKMVLAKFFNLKPLRLFQSAAQK